ncbi:F-BAR domain only protein 1 [Gadus morhua]|uniref:F-BAR domain only protein 1 n=1 Tax=Gadus morhua TaxID=8049 RepID=UPI0011B58613|nr:F-BAR domain only protein 1-like [Gadus morhua]
MKGLGRAAPRGYQGGAPSPHRLRFVDLCRNAEERRLLWKLSNLSPTNHSKGSGTLCASWQCLEVPRRPPPHLAVQFVGSGASLSGMDVELVGSRYRMSLVKKRFATGKYMAGCSL